MSDTKQIEIPFEYACEGIVRAAYDCECAEHYGADHDDYSYLKHLHDLNVKNEELKTEAIKCASYLSKSLKFAVESQDNEAFSKKINMIIKCCLLVPTYESIEKSFGMIYEAFDLVGINLPDDIVYSFMGD